MDHGSYSTDDGIMSGADSVIGQTRTVSCRMENEASVILSSHMVDVPKRMRISPESSECHTIDDSPMDMNALPPAAIPSADDVLVQMIIQSGATTFAQVVEFCQSAGIPLSRMLRLDLMRKLQQPREMEGTTVSSSMDLA